MTLDIQTNIASLQTQYNVSQNTAALQGSFAKLSSGLRVNSAADDAAGLAISENMKAQIRSYAVAQRNAGDGISMAQTAEGALGQIHDILGRMRELATQASNGTLGSSDQTNLDNEFTSLKEEIGRIQSSTQFNGKQLIASTASGDTTGINPSTVNLQVGLGGLVGSTDSSDTLSVSFNGINLGTGGTVSSTDTDSTDVVGDYQTDGTIATGTGANLTDTTSAQSALTAIDGAIQLVSNARAGFGAIENRLTYASNNIQTMSTNLTAANGRIVDVDVAAETANMSKNQVLAQAGISVLAQANQLPQLAFGLIGK